MAQFLLVLQTVNRVLTALFLVCYSYQFFYIFVSLFWKPRTPKESVPHKFAVIISARNEEAVIGGLIDSIKNQTYPSELVTTFVVADNCTDATAEISREAGAVVYERNDLSKIGKGYAIEFLMERINEDYPRDAFDAFIVFDADNVLEKNYIEEINKTYSAGFKVVTSYRNSKNYGDNWISSGYALWFLREARYLNAARMVLGTSCAVSGTGFLFDRSTVSTGEDGKLEWKYFLLTEDIQFTTVNILSGVRIGYCGTAHFYDEQPTKFGQSWRQRLRWGRGYLQVYRYYGIKLIKGIFRRRRSESESRTNFACFDMAMSIMPAMILSLLILAVDIIGTVGTLVTFFEIGETFGHTIWLIIQPLLRANAMMFVLGVFTTITEWRNIHTSVPKKLLFMLTFPIFMMTYIPIAIASFFAKVSWTHIDHVRSVSIDEIKEGGKAGVKEPASGGGTSDNP
ncbi:MAG: glycosyltransferase family 2 protein [Clostridia bacterium]|nr:glycosyltransferase family 2 protein [Clostridia bacterium]MBQ7474538.1 glycosyltransferase family 2 protein [Clostridia bacterium]